MAPRDWGRTAAVAGAVLLAAALALELSRPDLLIVGNITVDIVGDATPTGGAVSYAAVAARALGARACVVTVSGPERAQQLDVFAGHDVTVIPAPSTLTFAHTYTWFGSHRKLQVTANPNITVGLSHVPWRCRRARAVILGPLTLHDIDAASFLPHHSGPLSRLLAPQPLVGLIAQGFQRALGPQGEVMPLDAPSQQLMDGLSPAVSLFLSDVETDAWPPGSIQGVAARSARTLVTRGEKGADEYAPRAEAPRHIPPVKIDAVDTNGAGDTFATAYMVALLLGERDPGAYATWAASRAVMQPQSCKPHCAPALLSGGPLRRVTPAARLRLAAAALLRRAGLEAPARVLAAAGGLRGAGEAVLAALGVRARSAA